MKKLTLLIILVLHIVTINSSHAQSGWIQQQSGTNLKLCKVFFINSQTGWIVGDSGKILHTSNGGVNWISQISNTNEILRSVYFINENTGWAVGGKYNYKTFSPVIIIKTTDKGNTWSIKYNLYDFNNTLYSIWFINENTGYACGNGSYGFELSGMLMKSTDSGESWFYQDNNFYPSSNINFTSSNTGWIIGNYADDVGQDSGYILKSINSGLNWNKAYVLFKSGFGSSSFINDLTGWIGVVDRTSTPHQNVMLKTTDGSSNWQRINLSSDNEPVSIFFTDSDKGWSCDGSIFHTSDGGLNWLRQKEPGSALLSIYFTDPLNGWAVGNNGTIFSTSIGGINSINNFQSNAPLQYSLSQNYPNPFNPSTVIRYSLIENGLVTLKVYDVLGNEIATLVNEHQSQGNYNYQFSTVNYQLSSGIYFYKLTAGEFSETKRMILLK